MSGRKGGLSRAEAQRGINEAVAVVQPRPSGREDGSHPPKTGTQNLNSVKPVGRTVQISADTSILNCA